MKTDLEVPTALREWLDGFSSIAPDDPPRGFPAQHWQALHRDGTAFLTTWGVKAVALGWSTLDVFGVHLIAPAANYSAMGLVPLLRGAVVVALTGDSAVIQKSTGSRLTFRRQPPQDEAIPVWELVRSTQRPDKNDGRRHGRHLR